MSRLTNRAYISTHQELHAAWTADPTSIFLLSALDQWALHEYYRPSDNLDDAALIEHRHAVSTPGSSLPQRAGRAVTKWRVKQTQLETYRSTPRPSRRGTKRSQNYEIRLFAEVKPQLDPDEFARIILQARAEEQRSNVRPASACSALSKPRTPPARRFGHTTCHLS